MTITNTIQNNTVYYDIFLYKIYLLRGGSEGRTLRHKKLLVSIDVNSAFKYPTKALEHLEGAIKRRTECAYWYDYVFGVLSP